MMTKQEMINEIIRIEREVRLQVRNTKDWILRNEFMDLKDEYIVKGGYKRLYIASNTKKDELENMLTATINACYDTYGMCY